MELLLWEGRKCPLLEAFGENLFEQQAHFSIGVDGWQWINYIHDTGH